MQVMCVAACRPRPGSRERSSAEATWLSRLIGPRGYAGYIGHIGHAEYVGFLWLVRSEAYQGGCGRGFAYSWSEGFLLKGNSLYGSVEGARVS